MFARTQSQLPKQVLGVQQGKKPDLCLLNMFHSQMKPRTRRRYSETTYQSLRYCNWNGGRNRKRYFGIECVNWKSSREKVMYDFLIGYCPHMFQSTELC